MYYIRRQRGPVKGIFFVRVRISQTDHANEDGIVSYGEGHGFPSNGLEVGLATLNIISPIDAQSIRQFFDKME